MKKLLLLLPLLLLSAIPSRAQLANARGWCEDGGQNVILSGLQSTTQVQASYPQCTVSVSIHGAGAATIFSTGASAPLSNPFTATSNGQWIFYAANGEYDITLSGAGFPSPVTYSDIFILTSSGGGGGGTPSPPLNSLQYDNAGSFGGAAGLTTPDGNILQIKGPSPWADITAPTFGARAVGTTVYPHTTVATCTATSTAVTLSGTGQVSTAVFQNGDGISLFGCGFAWNGTGTPSSTPGAPTITNVIATGGAALGGGNYASSVNVVDGTGQGATTTSYKIVAVDKYGAYTAASSAGTTTTGQATLGVTNCTINTESLSGSTITVTFAAPCYVTAGAMVHVTGTSVASPYTGWFALASVNTGTYESMTMSGPISSTGLGGATTSSSGGNMAFYYANHLKWTPIAGTYQYYIYRTNVLIGVTKPSTSIDGWIESQFDDYGSTYMASQSYPAWLPTSPPGAAVAAPLSGTITNGANTTAITVSVPAQTSSGGGIATFDDGPTMQAAFNSAACVGGLPCTLAPVYIPPATNVGQTYVYPIFSYLVVPTQVNVKQAGELLLNATMEFQGSNDWDGSWANYAGMQFSNNGNSLIAVATANPGILVSGSWVHIHDVQVQSSGVTNGGTLIVSESVNGPTLDRVNLLAGGQGSADYLSMCFVGRSTGAGGTDYWWTGVTCNSGPNQVANKSWTPNMYFPPFQNGSGALLNNQQIFFKCTDCNWSIRGIEQEQSAGNGGTWELSGMHRQGGITPMLLLGNSLGAVGAFIHLNYVVLDSESVSTVASVGNGATVNPYIIANMLLDSSSDSGGIPPPFTGTAPNCATVFASAIGPLPNIGSSGQPCFVMTEKGFRSTGIVAALTTFQETETTAPTCLSSIDMLWADSTAHRWKMCNNNGSADTVVGAATTDTLTNKTYDTAGTGNTFKINGTTLSAVKGNTVTVQLESGSLATGNLLSADANGNAVDSGVPAASVGGAFTAVNVTPVTVNANTASDQTLMAVTITAATLNTVKKTILVQSAGVYSTPAASTTTVTVKLKLCTVSGCGSGTVITLATWTSAALGAVQATNDPFNATLNFTTTTAGASAAFESHGNLTIDIAALAAAAEAVYADNNTATVGTIDSTAQLFLQETIAFSAASASNSATQRQLIVDSVD